MDFTNAVSGDLTAKKMFPEMFHESKINLNGRRERKDRFYSPPPSFSFFDAKDAFLICFESANSRKEMNADESQLFL